MSKFPRIIMDETKNSPADMTAKMSIEDIHDILHHTHNISDLVGSEDIGYDDSKIRKDFDEALDDLFNKIMGITDEDSTTVDEAYDTLKEVSKYIKEDGSAAAEIINNIAAIEKACTTLTEALNGKVDTVDGKSLVDDVEIERLSKVDNYDDTAIRELIKTIANSIERKKFVINGTPDGTLVKYDEKEIRIMCPANTEWKLHTGVGENGNPNMFYMSFKAYAPEGAVSFKEGDRGVIVDEMFTFEDKFAGKDEHGNYSICWLALASYNEATDTWTYFGKNSSAKKYIGWDYVVEWYNAEGVVMAADSIRINLSNEDCHLINEPYYVSKIMAEIEELKK